MKLRMPFSKLIIFLLSILLFASACKKVNFGDINRDPNRTTEPNTAALLTNVLSGFGNTVWDQGGVRTLPGLYAQYFSETQYTDASRYSRPTANWDGFYAGAMYDLQNIINTNSDAASAVKATLNGSNANQIALARILKAYYFWWITDIWGDLPYSQALKGNGNIPYDKQETVYPALISELKAAVAQFDNGLGPKGDIVYGGDVSKWKKFANSLRMLMALQMSKVNPGVGKTEFAAALADPAGSIADNTDNATLVYPGGNYQNPFYNYYNIIQRDDYSVAKTIMDTLSAYGDRRINVYGSSTVGFPYGLTRDNAVAFANSNTNYARLLHPSVRNETDPVVVLGAAHILLARAEAAFLGWTSENVTTLYNQATDQSWRQWGVYDATAYAAYIGSPKVDLSAGDAYRKIATQEWLTWYPNGVRGWSVWRRTGYPVLTPAPGQPNPIPRRIPYGPNEPQLNPTNYAAAAANYTGADGQNSQFAKVWWDK